MDSGLVINSQWSYIGASSDRFINCTFCGKGALEIKCPFKHAYYYQVQTQLFVCDVDYADFCVCTFLTSEENIHDDNGIHIEHVYKDLNFWTDCVAKSQHFF